MDRIVVFHMNQLGDLLFSLPLLYNLNQTGKYIIYSVVKPYLIQLLHHTKIVQEIIPRSLDLSRRWNMWTKIKSINFQIAIILSNSYEPRVLSFFTKIPKRIGFTGNPFNFMLTHKVNLTGVPSSQNNLRVLNYLDITSIFKKDYLGLFDYTLLNNIDIFQPHEYLRTALNEKQFIIVAPGVSRKRPEKKWNPLNFSRVIDYLSARWHLPCLIVGSDNEVPLARQISSLCQSKVYNYTGKFNLEQLTLLLKQSMLVLTVDSGVMHLAAAVGTPVLALFGPTNPALIGPQGQGHMIIKKDRMDEIYPEDVISLLNQKINNILDNRQ